MANMVIIDLFQQPVGQKRFIEQRLQAPVLWQCVGRLQKIVLRHVQKRRGIVVKAKFFAECGYQMQAPGDALYVVRDKLHQRKNGLIVR